MFRNAGLTLLFLALAASACLSPTASGAAGETERVLYVFTWHDYFSGDLIREFEEKHDCRVEFDYYDSNETMFEALSSGGGGYDILTPAGNITPILFEKGLLRKLDHKLLPNLQYLDHGSTAASEDPGNVYSVPYTVTVTGVGYNKKIVPDDALGSWNIFADGRLTKRMAMLNDMREVLGAGLKELGKSLNSTNRDDLRAAGDLVVRWKRNLAMFDVDLAKEGLRTGKLVAIQAYNGDIAELMIDNPNIGFFVPSEGSAFNSDNLVVAADSASPELAHAFIDFFLEPGVAARNMEAILYYMPNAEAHKRLPPDFLSTLAFDIPDEVKKRCEVIRHLGDSMPLYDAAWSDVLLGGE